MSTPMAGWLVCDTCGQFDARLSRIGMTCNKGMFGGGYCQGKLIDEPKAVEPVAEEPAKPVAAAAPAAPAPPKSAPPAPKPPLTVPPKPPVSPPKPVAPSGQADPKAAYQGPVGGVEITVKPIDPGKPTK